MSVNFLSLDNDKLLVRLDSILAVGLHIDRIELVTAGGPLHINYGSVSQAKAEYRVICEALLRLP